MLRAGEGEFLHRIPLEGGGVGEVVVAGLGGIHREAVVVLGRDDHVFHPGILREGGPLAGVEFHRVELRGQLFVFRDRDFFVPHEPLSLRRNGIETPVDEHAELGVAPPGHPGIVLFAGLRIPEGSFLGAGGLSVRTRELRRGEQ